MVLLATACTKDKETSEVKSDSAASGKPAVTATATAAESASSAAVGDSAGAAAAPGSATASSTGAASTAAADSAAPAAEADSSPATEAYAHLPRDCGVVARINLARLASNPIIERDVLPLFDELENKLKAKESVKGAVDAFLADAGIKLRSSFRSVAVCVRDAQPEPKVVVIAAGALKPETVIAAAEKAFPKMVKPTLLEGRKVVSDKKLLFGQAADGALIVADSQDIFLAAMAPSESYKQIYQLPLTGELSWLVTEPFIKAQLAKDPKGSQPFQGLSRASGIFDLRAGKGEVRIACTTAEDATKIAGLAIIAKTQMKGDLAGKVPAAVASALEHVSVSASGKDVVLEAPISAEAVNALAQLFKDQVHEIIDKP